MLVALVPEAVTGMGTDRRRGRLGLRCPLWGPPTWRGDRHFKAVATPRARDLIRPPASGRHVQHPPIPARSLGGRCGARVAPGFDESKDVAHILVAARVPVRGRSERFTAIVSRTGRTIYPRAGQSCRTDTRPARVSAVASLRAVPRGVVTLRAGRTSRRTGRSSPPWAGSARSRPKLAPGNLHVWGAHQVSAR